MNRLWKSLILLNLAGMCLLFYLVMGETWSMLNGMGKVIDEYGRALVHTERQVENLYSLLEDIQYWKDGMEDWADEIESRVGDLELKNLLDQ